MKFLLEIHHTYGSGNALDWIKTWEKRIYDWLSVSAPKLNSSVKFWYSLEDAFGSLDGYEVILMGDLNVDFSDHQDKNYVHMKHVCLSMNLRNLISSPTRTTATTAKILDVVLTNIEQCSITGGRTEQVDFSDHAAARNCHTRTT